MTRVLRFSAAGPLRPGALAAFLGLFGAHDAELLDVGEAVEEGVQAIGLVAALAAEADHAGLVASLEARSRALGWQASVADIDRDDYEAQRSAGQRHQHRLTLLARRLPAAAVARAVGLVEDHGLVVARCERLTARRSLREGGEGRHVGVDLLLQGSATAPDDLRARLLSFSDELEIDIAFQLVGPAWHLPRLALFDMDGTLITCECIDELAKMAGKGAEVAAVTAAAMRGELDFAESFRRRLAALKGLPASMLDELAARLPYMPGLERAVAGLKRIGCRLAIVSGGFTHIARHIQQRFGFDACHANELEIVDGRFSGRHLGEIIDGPRKAALLVELAERYQVPLGATVAVGDGANDLPMLAAAGVGIAFHGKPKVRAGARVALSNVGLDGVLTLLGLRDWELER